MIILINKVPLTLALTIKIPFSVGAFLIDLFVLITDILSDLQSEDAVRYKYRHHPALTCVLSSVHDATRTLYATS